MHDLLLPPGVTLSRKDLRPQNYGQDSMMNLVVMSSIINQLTFLESARFSPSPDMADNYFRTWGIVEYDITAREQASKKLLACYLPQLQEAFEKGRADKIRMLAICLSGIMDLSYCTMNHQTVLRRLLDHGLVLDTPGWNSTVRAILIDTNIRVNAGDNSPARASEYNIDGTRENALEQLDVVYKDELREYLDTIAKLCDTCHAGKLITDGAIWSLMIIAKCIVPVWYRNKTLSLREHSDIERRLLWEQISPRQFIRDDADYIGDIDPATLVMTELFHEAVRYYQRTKDRMLKSGYQNLLVWMVIERFVLSLKYPRGESSTDCNDCPGTIATKATSDDY